MRLALDLINGLPSIVLAVFIFGLLVDHQHQSVYAASIALAIADDLDTAIRAFSNIAKLKALLSTARSAVGEITLAISSRFFASCAIAEAVRIERYSAANVLGFCLTKSSDTPNAQHGWPSQMSFDRMWMKPTPS